MHPEVDVADALRHLLQEHVAGDGIFHDDANLMDAGLDSASAVELRNQTKARFKIPVPVTFMFDYPTIADMVPFIQESMLGNSEAVPEASHALVAGERLLEHRPNTTACQDVLTPLCRSGLG